jgi:hypothetical protein
VTSPGRRPRKTPAYTGRENPRPLTPSLSLCHGCGADREAARCRHCGGHSFEAIAARASRTIKVRFVCRGRGKPKPYPDPLP